MATKVTGELYESLIRQLFEIGRQLHQPNGYPFDPKNLQRCLQDVIEGKFGEPKFILTNPFDLAFLDKGWTTWKGPIDGDGLSGEEDIDLRSSALSEIEIDKFLFETCLREGESRITGEEKLRRLKEKTEFVRFGGTVFFGLWEDYQTNGENSILEHLYKTQKVSFMDFLGTILRSPHGHRCVLYLYRDDDGEWHWGYYWLDRGWDADYPSVGCAS